ncbi:MAG: glycosyltransferase family 9 protein [bacterium]
MQKILILNFTRMGDLIETTSLFKRIKLVYPESHVTLAVVPQFYEICEFFDFIDEIKIFDMDNILSDLQKDDFKFNYETFKKFENILKEFTDESYEIVFNLTHDIASSYFMYILNSKKFVGFSRNREDNLITYGEYLKFFSAVAKLRKASCINLVDIYEKLFGENIPFRLNNLAYKGEIFLNTERKKDAKENVEAFFKDNKISESNKIVSFAIGASSPLKKWKKENFAKLGKLLLEYDKNIKILILGAKYDEEGGQFIKNYLDDYFKKKSINNTNNNNKNNKKNDNNKNYNNKNDNKYESIYESNKNFNNHDCNIDGDIIGDTEIINNPYDYSRDYNFYNSVIDLTGKTTVAELVNFVQKSSLLITNDTGTMHIGVAVKTDVAVVYTGQAGFYETGPYRENQILILPDIPCFPCDFKTNCTNYLCGEYIKPKDVFKIIKLKFENKNNVIDKNDFRNVSFDKIIPMISKFDGKGYINYLPLKDLKLTVDDFKLKVFKLSMESCLANTAAIPLDKKDINSFINCYNSIDGIFMSDIERLKKLLDKLVILCEEAMNYCNLLIKISLGKQIDNSKCNNLKNFNNTNKTDKNTNEENNINNLNNTNKANNIDTFDNTNKANNIENFNNIIDFNNSTDKKNKAIELFNNLEDIDNSLLFDSLTYDELIVLNIMHRFAKASSLSYDMFGITLERLKSFSRSKLFLKTYKKFIDIFLKEIRLKFK